MIIYVTIALVAGVAGLTAGVLIGITDYYCPHCCRTSTKLERLHAED